MDSAPFEYTKFPQPQPQPEVRRVASGAAAAPAGATAAAVAFAACLAAVTFLFPKAVPVVPATSAPAAAVLEEPAPIEPREARPQSPLPIAYTAAEKITPPAAMIITQGPAVQMFTAPAPSQAPVPDAKNVPLGRSQQPSRPRLKSLASWTDDAKESGPVGFKIVGPAPTPVSMVAAQAPDQRQRLLTHFIGKERPDYRVVKKERPDYRVKYTEQPKAHVPAPPIPSARLTQNGLFGPKYLIRGRGAECPACGTAEDAAGLVVSGQIPTVGGDAGGQFNRGFGGGPGAGFGTPGIGRLEYVGPCATGSAYRLTNTLGRRLGSTTLIGDSGEVWNVKALKPGESVEIRSRGLISSLSTAP